MKHLSIIMTFSVLVFFSLSCNRTVRTNDTGVLDDLRIQLYEYTDSLDATVGIAVITSDGDTMTVNNSIHYPMMSVFKFHQALAVADCLQKKGISLDSCIHIYPEDLVLDTWSPMKNDFPEGNVDISIRKLLEYTVPLSDNLACDVLFDRLVSPSQVEMFIKSHGVDNISIRYTEAQMYHDNDLSYGNWTTPYSAALLLDKFIDGLVLEEPGMSYIRKLMLDCTTGTNRLVSAFVNTDYRLGHKTGSGYVKDGRIISTNDIGFVLSPDGSKLYTIAVFVMDSGLNGTETEKIIGTVSDKVLKVLSDTVKKQ